MGLNASRVWLDRELAAGGSSRSQKSLLPDVSTGSHMHVPNSAELCCESAGLVLAEQGCGRGTGRTMSVGRAVSGQSVICPS